MNPAQLHGAELPDPFRSIDGARVRCPGDWPRRRREIAALLVGLEYGGLPPEPAATRGEELHATSVPAMSGARFVSWRVVAEYGQPCEFLLTLLVPAGDGPFPVVLTGDACWHYATDAVAAEILRRGHILAQFNREAIAPDISNAERRSGLYRVCPDGDYGALAAWAWGYHRCVDVLARVPYADAARLAVVGHSRGGKAALLAGATDERIAVTAANNSGAGGAGCYRWQAPGSETLADLLRAFPYWFGPRLRDYLGRETELPFDQHELKALVAPRALLTTEALDDLWANPAGTRQTHQAAREVYRFLGVGDKIGLRYRPGAHEHAFADWQAMLDFMDWQLDGRTPAAGFDDDPFPDCPPAFAWRAPAR